MSIRTMRRVWDYSEQEGSRLLLLLALADFSDDEGYCWPKLDVLATKARVSRRTAQYAIEALVGAGELLRTDGRGRGNGATYRVTTGLDGASLAPLDDSKKVQSAARKGAIHNAQKVQPATRKGATCDTHIENCQEPSMGTVKVTTPPTPSLPAGKPVDPLGSSQAPARELASAVDHPAPRSKASCPASASPAEKPASRWQPVADAIAAAVRYPLAGRKPPSWLGNTIRAFGAAAGDDPARALALVRAWAETRGLTDLVTDQRYFAFRRVPENAHAWLASQRGRSVSAGVTAGLEDAQLVRMGAPANWRDVVFAPGGIKRAPALALPLMGLEPYAPREAWPAWYRAAEGVAS